MEDIIKCTSNNCPYKSSCYRQSDEEPPSKNTTYFNYEYTCNFNSGYDQYIRKIIK